MPVKPLFLFIALIWVTSGIYSQDPTHRFEFGFSIQPQLGKLIIKSGTFYNSTFQFSYAIGGDIFYRLSPRIQVSSGLEYQQADLNLRDESLMFPMDVIDGMWVRGRSYYAYEYNYDFIGVPLSLLVRLGMPEKTSYFFVEGGISVRFKMNQSGQTYLNESGFKNPEEDLEESEIPDTPGTWLFGKIGIGYIQRIGKLSIRISPTFEYSPTNIQYEKQSIGEIDGHPFLLGLSIGIMGNL